MNNIDYNSIKFEQFVGFLPDLKVSYEVSLDCPELLLLTFPVFEDNDPDLEVYCNIIAGYRGVGNSMIIHPIGTIGKESHPSKIISSEEEAFAYERVCIVSGRLDVYLKISFSSLQGSLCRTESDSFLPCSLQEAGEKVFKYLFFNQYFFHSEVGNKSLLTTSEWKTQEDETGQSHPFATVASKTSI